MSAQVHSFHEDPKCWLNHDHIFSALVPQNHLRLVYI